MRVMVVKGVMHHSNNHTALLKLETEAADLRLELAIPRDEANRLVRMLGAVGCRCTSIYETLLILAERMAVALVRAILDGGTEGISASLVFAHRGAEMVVPCHPADAVALALRTHAPVYATASALTQAYPTRQHATPKEPGNLVHWLEGLRPSDFDTD